MSNHFSAIGFDVSSLEAIRALAATAAKDAREIRTDAGSYLLWECPSGAQLWLQLGADRSLISMHPHFHGCASLRVRITNRVRRPKGTPLDGAFHAWADPDGEEGGGAYPFVFDCPDAACHAALQLPARTTASVAAFTGEISVHATEADRPKLPEGQRGFAVQHFIPQGLFTEEGSAEPPRSTAIFGGLVREASERVNRMTGRGFVALRVESYGGDYDVVADREQLPEVPPLGSVVAGAFWLSGRITPA